VVPAALIPGLVLLLAGDQLRAPDSHVIAVSGALDQSCPAARQVTDALAARLPGFVLPNGQAARPGMLRLAVASHYGATLLRLRDALLSDPQSDTLEASLSRALAVGASSGADTVTGLVCGISASLSANRTFS